MIFSFKVLVLMTLKLDTLDRYSDKQNIKSVNNPFMKCSLAYSYCIHKQAIAISMFKFKFKLHFIAALNYTRDIPQMYVMCVVIRKMGSVKHISRYFYTPFPINTWAEVSAQL